MDQVAASALELKNLFRRMGVTYLMTMNSQAHDTGDIAKMQSSGSGAIRLNRILDDEPAYILRVDSMSLFAFDTAAKKYHIRETGFTI